MPTAAGAEKKGGAKSGGVDAGDFAFHDDESPSLFRQGLALGRREHRIIRIGPKSKRGGARGGFGGEQRDAAEPTVGIGVESREPRVDQGLGDRQEGRIRRLARRKDKSRQTSPTVGAPRERTK